MKAMFFSGALLLSSFLSFAGGETDEPSRYPVDVTTSSVTWVGTKVTGSHNGDIQINNGMLTIEDGMISAATVIIDMGTIKLMPHDEAEDIVKMHNGCWKRAEQKIGYPVQNALQGFLW